MCQIVRECGNFHFAQGIGDIRLRRHAATDSHVLLVVVQRLDRVFLALAGKTRHRLRSRECIAVA